MPKEPKADLSPSPDYELKMSEFEELEVVGSAIEIPGAAGGLRDAMKIEPREFHHGERVFVVLECIVGKVRHQPVKKDDVTGPQTRVHTFLAGTATIIDSSYVLEAIDAQKEKVREAQDRAKGVSSFNWPEGSDEERAAQARRIREWLGTLKRDQLAELCAAHEVEYKSRTSAPAMIELLVAKAPEIEKRMDGEHGIDDENPKGPGAPVDDDDDDTWEDPPKDLADPDPSA